LNALGSITKVRDVSRQYSFSVQKLIQKSCNFWKSYICQNIMNINIMGRLFSYHTQILAITTYLLYIYIYIYIYIYVYVLTLTIIINIIIFS